MWPQGQFSKKPYHAADPDRMSDIGVYDVESFRIAKGMASYPAWTEVMRPTWQYGLSKASNFGKDDCSANIDSQVINSMEHINLAKDRRDQGAQTQWASGLPVSHNECDHLSDLLVLLFHIHK